MKILALLHVFALLTYAGTILPDLNPAVDPGQFQVTEIASGLNFPTSMSIMPDGSLLVGTTVPAGVPVAWENYYTGTGQLLLLDGSAQSVVANLPGAITTVRQAGNLVLVATTGNNNYNQLFQTNLVLLQPGTGPTAPYTQVGNLQFNYNSDQAAPNVTLAVAPNGTSGFNVYFGIQAEMADGTPGNPVTMSGALAGQLASGAIYEMQLDTSGSAPVLSQPVEIADGIRNSAGIMVDSSGNLIFGDNGEDAGYPCPTDVIDTLPAGTTGVPSYGYPGNCTDLRGASVAFVNGPVGINELVAAPADFPAGFNTGIFAGFDGSFYPSGVDNPLDALVYADPTTGVWEDFILPSQAGLGHPVGLAVDGSTLYVANMNLESNFVGGTGNILAITVATPEPSTGFLTLLAILSGLLLSFMKSH